MPSCVFRKCRTYTGTTVKGRKDVSFHLFPKDGLVREKWIQIVRIQRREDDWIPTRYSVICSQHFLETDKYVTKNNVRKLKNSALPVNKHKENLGEVNNTDEDTLKDVYISDRDTILDTPKEAYLKTKITKISRAKRKLQMKNYNLAKQNKRLKEKCEYLQRIVLKFKKKKYFAVGQLNDLKAEPVESTNQIINTSISSFSNNCVASESIPILTCSSRIQNIDPTAHNRAYDSENVILNSDIEYTESDLVVDGNLDIFSTLLNRESVKKTIVIIIGFISGWVSRKLLKALKCGTCINSLFSNVKLWFHKIISLKNIEGLCYPSEDVFKICLRSESILKNLMKEKGNIMLPDLKDIEVLKNKILKSFVDSPGPFQSLEVHSSRQPLNFNHRIHLIRAIIKKFINVRLHYVQRNNYNCNEVYKRQKRNKLNLFESL